MTPGNSDLKASLRQLWEQVTRRQPSSESQRYEQMIALYRHGRGISETFHFLHLNQPSLHQFLEWVSLNQTDVNPVTPARQVLSPADLHAWEENGYLLIPGVLSAEECSTVCGAIWQFLGADPADPASWYSSETTTSGLMLEFFQHPALNILRRSAKLRGAYEQLFRTDQIVANVEKVSFNPPETATYSFAGSPLHWDTSLHLPIPFRLQGLLYLTDTTANGGAFCCVPGFHHRIDQWLSSLPPELSPRDAAPRQLEPVHVPGNAGDFIIWHQALPHAATPNRSVAPRMVQYLTYEPLETVLHSEEWI